MAVPDLVQIVMTRRTFRQLQSILVGNGHMAVPLPREISGEDDLPTFVIWPIETAIGAGFTTENTVTFGQSESTPTERSTTSGNH